MKILKPWHDNIVIEPNDEEKTTPSGIVIPDNATEKVTRGKIIAVGPGRRDNNGCCYESNLRVGEEVLYGKYAGTEIQLDGKKQLVLSEAEILGVVKDAE